MEPKKTPVHKYAESLDLPVETPLSLKSDEAIDRFRSYAADVAVVVAYGLLLPREILDIPSHGCLNFHPSNLPRWRGAAPLQRTIMAGDSETAACVMRMEVGLDTGPVCLKEQISVPPDMTAGELHDLMALRGGDLMVRVLGALERGTLDCTAQHEHGVTYAAKIDKSEARIDWSQPAADVHNLIRGLSPFPGAWFEATIGEKAERIKVLRATPVEDRSGVPGTLLDDNLTVACGTAAVRLLEVQRAGRKPVSATEFLHGAALVKHAQF